MKLVIGTLTFPTPLPLRFVPSTPGALEQASRFFRVPPAMCLPVLVKWTPTYMSNVDALATTIRCTNCTTLELCQMTGRSFHGASSQVSQYRNAPVGRPRGFGSMGSISKSATLLRQDNGFASLVSGSQNRKTSDFSAAHTQNIEKHLFREHRLVDQ